MSAFGIFFRSTNELECVDGWFKCLRCSRFFTKRVGDLFCYDCCRELRTYD